MALRCRRESDGEECQHLDRVPRRLLADDEVDIAYCIKTGEPVDLFGDTPVWCPLPAEVGP